MRTDLAIIVVLTTLLCLVGCVKEFPETVPQEEMEKVFEEVKTPFKRGLVIPGRDGLAADSPSVFRKDGKWYMVYIIFDGRGYETWLAESEELLEWKTLGRIMSYSDDTDWDVNQKAGYLALVDPKWGGAVPETPLDRLDRRAADQAFRAIRQSLCPQAMHGQVERHCLSLLLRCG